MSVKSMTVYKVGDKLNKKQQLWIDEYIKTDDYATATLRAGYKTKHARQIGYENSLRFKDIIEHRRAELNEKLTSKTISELEDIQEFWTKVYTSDDNKLNDRLKASELLAKSKGGFIEHVEVKEINTDWFVEDNNNG